MIQPPPLRDVQGTFWRLIRQDYTAPDLTLQTGVQSAINQASDPVILRHLNDLLNVVTQPHGHIVHAAFHHAGDSRFNTHANGHGVWYAADSVDTAVSEIAYHLNLNFTANFTANLTANLTAPQHVTYVPYSCAVSELLYDVSEDTQYCLFQLADQNSYTYSRALAAHLRADNRPGVIYPSVRHPGGTCVALMNLTSIRNVQAHEPLTLTWTPGQGVTVT